MSLIGLLRKLRPGLPQFSRDLPEMWVIDPDPTPGEIDKYSLVFLVGPGDGEGALLANRTGQRVEIDEQALLEEVDAGEKKYTRFDGPAVFIREFRLLTVNETVTHSESEGGLQSVPSQLCEKPLPQREFTEDDRQQMVEAF